MGMRKGLVLMLVAATMSIMLVASATSPIMNGFKPSGDQAPRKDSAYQDNPLSTPAKTGTKETAKNGVKGSNEKATLKDASGLSVMRGKVLDMKTGRPVAGALVVLQPINAGPEMKIDPIRPVESQKPVQIAGCEKKEASGGCCRNGGAGYTMPGQNLPQPQLEPIKPPMPSEPPMPSVPPVPPGPSVQPMPPKPPIVPVPQPLLQTKTDAKGIYSIKIKTGYFMLNVMVEGYMPFFDDVCVPKATKFDHDVALKPMPIPDSRIDGFVSDAADGKRLSGVNVLIVRLPADLPFTGEALRGIIARYLGERFPAPPMAPDNKCEMNEKGAQRQNQDANGQLTDEQARLMREKLAQEQNTDASGQLTDEQARLMREKLAQEQNTDASGQLTDEQVRIMNERRVSEETGANGIRDEDSQVYLKEMLARLTEKLNERLTDEQRDQITLEIQAIKERMVLQQQIQKDASEQPNFKTPMDCCPAQPPLPPVPLPPKDPAGMVMPETMYLLTDQKGHFDAKVFSGRFLVIAFARGHDPQWALVDIPAKSSISIQLNLAKNISLEPVMAAPDREPAVFPGKETPDNPPNPR